MRRYIIPTAFLFSASVCAAALPSGVPPSVQCDTDTVQRMAPKDTTISFAARETFYAMPKREETGMKTMRYLTACRINGYVKTQNPGPNKVLFMLVLPDRFNGRYVYLGVGGAAGQLPTPKAHLVTQGYALAGSDGGTGAKTSSDFSFTSNEAKALDFAWRGVKRSAEATQHITKAYFGNKELNRYISGCSGGGQMGLGNARRFGAENFDGFLVGATPWPSTHYMEKMIRIAQHFQKHPDSWMPPELMQKAFKAIMDAYDETDGAKDGIIADQRNMANFDTRILKKVGFTPAQIEAFNFIRNPSEYPPRGPGDDGVQPGHSITAVSGWSAFLLGHRPPPWPSVTEENPAKLAASGAPYIHLLADTRTRAQNPKLDYNTLVDPAHLAKVAYRDGKDIPFEDPMDFGKLRKSGGKMIVYHGVNDQSMSYLETLHGYQQLLERYPDTRDWLRAFTLPGTFHCRGGNGPSDATVELLDALVAWVEEGKAPDSVTSPRLSVEKGLERNFLICAEPKRAHLKRAKLDPDKAENWHCKGPQQ